MTAVVINGNALSEKIQQELAGEVEQLKAQGKTPHLVAVQVGDNPASKIYAKKQQKSCEAIGTKYTLKHLPHDTDEAGLIYQITALNNDLSVSGIILQMPLPPAINARKIQALISPVKDVEGVNPANIGRLVYGDSRLGPCTAVGAVELLKSLNVPIEGQDAVVVGHSEIVGKPIGLLLLGVNATVSTVHVYTKDLASYVRKADILFVGTGKRQAVWLRYKRDKKKNPSTPPPDLSPLITADMLKPGAVVIDVAINCIPKRLDKKGEPVLNSKSKPAMVTVGDVDYEAALCRTDDRCDAA